MTKVFSRDVRAIFERLVRHRMPPVEQGDPCTEVPQSDGEIDHTAFFFEDGSATVDTGSVAIAPQDLVDGIVR
jgi:hypothetical protein